MNKRLKRLFEEADKAFDGKYAKEVEELNGLSRSEIDQIIPGTTDLKTYTVLVKLVEKASKENMDKAELIDQIKETGEIGISIAKTISGFYEDLKDV
ncbi:hypothetical protein ACFQ0R_06370 [Psychroflexus salinarum]|uniref:Uncharacterized protein n=1 Tax=Psychroflexus salinarum TaxID=546024 RepID=A0ABW3GQB1_9FLAO